MTKHASVHYLFAAVQNKHSSDVVMIDMTFMSMNVLQHTQGLKLTC